MEKIFEFKDISYEKALELCSNESSPFVRYDLEFDGYKISIFNYRLANFNDFYDNDAFEMRGITYVFDKDNNLFKRYLLLHKFFNLNQVLSTQYEVVKDYKIKSVYNKEDGSLISFINLPNNKKIAKTQNSFISEMAVNSTEIYNNNSDYKRAIDFFLENDINPIFEYVSYRNQVVLVYEEEKLILLKLRCNKTGEYLNFDDYSDVLKGIHIVNEENISLNDAIKLSDTVLNKEGWVFEFENGTFLKLKTQWYFALHGLLTNDFSRVNIMIRYILEEKMDDMLSTLKEVDGYVLNAVNEISHILRKYVNDLTKHIIEEYKLLSQYGYDIDYCKKMFSLNYPKHKYKSFIFAYVYGEDKLREQITRDLYRRTFRYENAKSFLKEQNYILR
jgi:RNA ligase